MDYADERLCCVALTLCEGIGTLTAQRLVKAAGSASAVFARRKELPRLSPDIQPGALKALDTPNIFARAEKELDFAERHGIECLTQADSRYPVRLRQCEDAPLFLFFKGKADLNSLRVVSMVGTRRATDYGRQFCNDFVRDLSAYCPDLLVVSGLAYGIDIAAHRAALSEQVPTVAVLAHGLDRIYPPTHRKTATDMHALVVVESGGKGGSLITAELANGYDRECFAVPGRAYDELSKGCNNLIRENKAALITGAENFVAAMGWGSEKAKPAPIQRSLFQELSEEESRIAQLLGQHGDLPINALTMETGIPVSRLSALLFEMEMKGIVKAQAGNKYHLLG